MNHDLSHARDLLSSTGCTCVFCSGSTVLTDHRRGIRPLLELYRSGKDLQGFSAADKAVGKAAAFLYSLMGVKEVYAPIISTAAIRILSQAGIYAVYDREVPAIENRSRTGLCPMETALADIHDPHCALAAMESTLANLTSHPG